MDERSDDPWLVRPYNAPRDEGGVVYLWLKSYAHSPHGRSRGAQVDGSDAERAYWTEHRPVVEYLLRTSDTTLLVDPEAPDVIWAFLVANRDLVHYGVVKRRFRDQATEMFAALVGTRAERPCVYTHSFQGTGFRVPLSWVYNPYTVLGGIS